MGQAVDMNHQQSLMPSSTPYGVLSRPATIAGPEEPDHYLHVRQALGAIQTAGWSCLNRSTKFWSLVSRSPYGTCHYFFVLYAQGRGVGLCPHPLSFRGLSPKPLAEKASCCDQLPDSLPDPPRSATPFTL